MSTKSTTTTGRILDDNHTLDTMQYMQQVSRAMRNANKLPLMPAVFKTIDHRAGVHDNSPDTLSVVEMLLLAGRLFRVERLSRRDDPRLTCHKSRHVGKARIDQRSADVVEVETDDEVVLHLQWNVVAHAVGGFWSYTREDRWARLVPVEE